MYIQLPGNVYNRSRLNKQLQGLKQQFRFKNIYHRVHVARKPKKLKFQLIKTDLPLFKSEYRPYNLHIYVVGYVKEGWGTGVYLDSQYGVVPDFSYQRRGILGPKDKLEMKFEGGLHRRTSLNSEETFFTWTQAAVGGKYQVPPIFKEIFAPFMAGKLHLAKFQREDLQIDKYLQFHSSISLNLAFRTINTDIEHVVERVAVRRSEYQRAEDRHAAIQRRRERAIAFTILSL